METNAETECIDSLWRDLGACSHGVVGGCDRDNGQPEEDPYGCLDVVEAYEQFQCEIAMGEWDKVWETVDYEPE